MFLVLSFAEGVLGHVHASWLDPSKVRRMTVVGSRRMVVYDDVAWEGKIKIYDKGIEVIQTRDVFDPENHELASVMPAADESGVW